MYTLYVNRGKITVWLISGKKTYITCLISKNWYIMCKKVVFINCNTCMQSFHESAMLKWIALSIFFICLLMFGTKSKLNIKY
jgi:hypothetical protein